MVVSLLNEFLSLVSTLKNNISSIRIYELINLNYYLIEKLCKDKRQSCSNRNFNVKEGEGLRYIVGMLKVVQLATI